MKPSLLRLYRVNICFPPPARLLSGDNNLSTLVATPWLQRESEQRGLFTTLRVSSSLCRCRSTDSVWPRPGLRPRWPAVPGRSGDLCTAPRTARLRDQHRHGKPGAAIQRPPPAAAERSPTSRNEQSPGSSLPRRPQLGCYGNSSMSPALRRFRIIISRVTWH